MRSRRRFNGRGEKLGQTLTDFNALPGQDRAEPARTSATTSSAPAGARTPTATPHRTSSTTVKNTTTLSNTIVDQQQNLDAFLVSAIGLADIGNDVVGANRQALTDVAAPAGADHRPARRVPRQPCAAASAGSSRSSKRPARPYPASYVSAGFTLGVERYRYPQDLPKVAAKSGGADCCDVWPARPAPELRAALRRRPTSVPTQRSTETRASCSTPTRSSSWLFGPLDGPPRNSAQIGQPG